jgi:hypothetical protein
LIGDVRVKHEGVEFSRADRHDDVAAVGSLMRIQTVPLDPTGRLTRLPREQIERLAPQQPQDDLLLPARALQRTSRLASDSPLAAPARGSDPSMTTSRTPDILTSSV